ncbi:hypothetical protein [Teredinibacter purpureus]|uniref:hypothetical protein n=1 Tax=Teredinibacter purpureus TaxID=2731756 RepID=UPI0005F82865|nr:hypothetical protein [Teredinibacter purpureus]
MKLRKIAIAALLMSGIFSGGPAFANEHAVESCSWTTSTISQTYYWLTAKSDYNCTLVGSGATVKTMTRTITQQKAPLPNGQVPGAPTCSIVDHGVYTHSGSCNNPTLIVPQPPNTDPDPEPCGARGGDYWGSVSQQGVTSSVINQVNAFCGVCSFTIRPLYSPASSNTPLGIWCRN